MEPDTHLFEIWRYSKARHCAESDDFAVRGHDWQIWFFPGGFHDACKDYVAMYLLFDTDNYDPKMRASFQLSLLDVTGRSPPHTVAGTLEFSSFGRDGCSAHDRFIKRSELEASPYLRGDHLVIQCVITFHKGPPSPRVVKPVALEMPPSDITEHLGKLLQGKQGVDVVFEVDGEAFPAHKLVVFKAKLYGAMREKDTSRITIGDVQPAVFEALLHFICPDSLPAAMDDLGCDDYREIVRHLLVAADRYAMERLKIICESILCKNIDSKTVVTTLALADQHHCSRLNGACVQFIASLGTAEMDDVIASQGYVELKTTSPLVLVELLEKIRRLGKSK